MKILCSHRNFLSSAKKSKKFQKYSKTVICISGVRPLQILFKRNFKKSVQYFVLTPRKALKHKKNAEFLFGRAGKTFLFLKALF